MQHRRSYNTAFTLVELLVVIGIIAILIAILIPALGKAKQQAQITVCMSNMKQLQTAWLSYANEYKGNIVWAETDGEKNADGTPNTNNKAKRDGWVIDVPGDPAFNTRAAVEKGLLWRYAPAAETYRCPASTDLFNYRSYSISTHANGIPTIFYPDFYTSGYPAGSPPPPIVTKINKLKNDRVVFVEEYDERGYNGGSFLQFRGAQFIWGDVPAFFHKKGTVMSFVDGHAEYKQWGDQRTFKAKRLPDPNSNQSNNQDLLWLKRAVYGPNLNVPPSSY